MSELQESGQRANEVRVTRIWSVGGSWGALQEVVGQKGTERGNGLVTRHGTRPRIQKHEGEGHALDDQVDESMAPEAIANNGNVVRMLQPRTAKPVPPRDGGNVKVRRRRGACDTSTGKGLCWNDRQGKYAEKFS